MATVPRAWIDGYADSLQHLDAYMRSMLKDALARVDYTAPVAEVRRRLIAIMQPMCYQSRYSAAQLAAEFYDGLRERMVGEGIETIVDAGYEPEAVERVVRASVKPLADIDGWEDEERRLTAEASDRVGAMLADYFGRGIREAAGNTVFANGRRDPRRVRFARIPRGSKSYPEGCPFCRMLASRGFAYLSELTAGGVDPRHYHDGCQCMVVPSWGPGSVEGFDPRDYDDGYQEWLDQDHSRHEANVRATQRNRYDAAGRLKSGDGRRVDEKARLTDADRSRIASQRTAAGNATRKANRERRFADLGVTESEWKAMSEAEQRALLREHGVNPVSGGGRYSELWLSQYENEVAVVRVRGKEIYRKEGTPNSSEFPKVLPKGYSYEEADLEHTHTNPIAGTFSDVDMRTTMETGCRSHTITHTLTGRTYRLERTGKATEESRIAFYVEFVEQYYGKCDDAKYDYWERHLKEHGLPADDDVERRVLAALQPEFDRWLNDNASRFGYEYSS